jgi:hypothetical protein
MIRLPARVASVFTVVFGALLVTSCADLPDRLSGPRDPSQQASFSAAKQQDIKDAIAAQEKHKDNLHKIKGVVGTAVGLLPDGRAAVQVLVIDASPRDIPATLDNIPVDVRVTGVLMALSDPTTRLRPALLGYSVGHPAITAGTIGARVKDAGAGLYVLSNNHVLANSNNAVIGDPTLQPGPYDGGTSADQIGTLYAFKPIDFSGGNNTFDAAIAVSDAVNLGNSTPTDDGYGLPSGTIFGDANDDRIFDDPNALLGVHVQKFGRTTKLTHGTITGINAQVDICYEVVFIFCVKSAHYVDQLIITPAGFSDGGDSGSLIVTDDLNKNPVALLFAGSSTETIGNRIDLVLNYFNVSIDASNEPPPPPPPPVTDVAVNSVTAPASVTQGATVTVSVVMKNVGNQHVGTFSVQLDDQTDGVYIGTKYVSALDPGESSISLNYSWNTTSRTLGSHTLVATSALVDDNPANNTGTATSQVNEPPPPVTDVEVNSVTAPASVTQGATVTVSVVMKNVGNQDVGAFSVQLDDQTDGVTIGTMSVSALAPGASSSPLDYSWNTTSSSLGSHTLVATSALADDNLANNTGTATSQVNAPPPPSVDIHIGDLDGSASRNGSTWSATVEITVHDANHAVLNGATVTGNWSRPGLNSNTCTTGDLGGNGTCIVLFPSISRSYKDVIFAVSSVTYPGSTYRQIQNHDPDGSSNGTGQKVLRP